MTQAFELIPAAAEHEDLLRQLFELYCYDFSEFTGEDVNEAGRYAPDEHVLSWSQAEAPRFLLRVDGRWAGFAWLSLNTSVITPGAARVWMSEFFVMRKYRRRGVGERMATQLFDQFPGPWEVGEIAANTPAQAFWRTIIARYTGGNFHEVQLGNERWRGPVQYFRSGDRSGAAR